MIMAGATALLAGGVLVLGWVLLGYPLLITWLAARRPRPIAVDPDHRPTVSLLISAYNEARDLPRKLASLAALDYPSDRLEILVADDGSADGTAAAVEAAARACPQIRLLARTENLGKAAQLNRLAAEAVGDILIFTDARQPLEPNAIARLVARFADPSVGGVTGAVAYRTAAGEPVPIGAYWRYESMLRNAEGAYDSCCGGAGPLQAVRADLFEPLPENVVLDDVLTPLRVVFAGYRYVYAPDAVAVETYAMNRRHEYDRRVRTMAGNYQILRLEPRLLNPWANRIWWQYASHKVGRLLVPWAMLAMLAGALLGWPLHPAFRVALGLQGLFYGYALIGWLTAGRAWAPKGSSLAYSLVLLAVTALAGLVRDLRGGSQARWGVAERARRA